MRARSSFALLGSFAPLVAALLFTACAVARPAVPSVASPPSHPIAPSAPPRTPQARADAIARASPDAVRAYDALVAQARAIHDDAMRRAVTDLLEHPTPTFLRALPDAAARTRIRDALAAAKLIDAKVTADELFPLFPGRADEEPTFLGAPGGTDDGHHAYPGGLAEHTAFNLRASLDLAASYASAYGLTALDRDALIAAPILHDALKPWVLRWRADGTLTPQATIAGTSSHHVFIVAEAIYRRLPADFVITLAAAHDAPMVETAKVVAYVQAGAIVAGIDPVEAALLTAKDGALTLTRAPSVEASIHHLSDHDWIVAEPSAHIVTLALARIVRGRAPSADASTLRWARHRIQAQVPGFRLYALWREGGDPAIVRALEQAHVPLVDPGDGAQN
jgi:hypothetical protein